MVLATRAQLLRLCSVIRSPADVAHCRKIGTASAKYQLDKQIADIENTIRRHPVASPSGKRPLAQSPATSENRAPNWGRRAWSSPAHAIALLELPALGSEECVTEMARHAADPSGLVWLARGLPPPCAGGCDTNGQREYTEARANTQKVR